MRLLAALLCLIATAHEPGAEEWTRFRGPNGSGISHGKGFPVEFSAERNLLWRTAVRFGKSSPVLSRRHVFLTGLTDQTLYTQCFDRHTGKLVWERSEPLTRDGGANPLNHPAAITPVTDGENVYVFFKDFGLLSYGPTGKLRWRVPLGPFTNGMGLAAAPLLHGDELVLQVDQLDGSSLSAYSTSNGELLWKAAREESESWGSPILYERPGEPAQVVTVGANQIGLHRVSDGKRTFTFRGASPVMVSTPVLDGDTLFAFGYGFQTRIPFARMLERSDTNKDGVIAPDEFKGVSALTAAGRFMGNRDGILDEKKWNQWLDHVGTGGPIGLFALNLSETGGEAPVPLWRAEKGFESVIPSPLVHDGVLYSVRNGGILTAYDARTGAVTKTGRIPGAPGGYSASPVFAEGNLYFGGEEGKIAVVRAGREWELIQLNDLGEEIFATPALSGGQIFVRSGEALYCFGAK